MKNFKRIIAKGSKASCETALPLQILLLYHVKTTNILTSLPSTLALIMLSIYEYLKTIEELEGGDKRLCVSPIMFLSQFFFIIP